MGNFKDIHYFLVCDAKKEFVEVPGPGSKIKPRHWNKNKVRIISNWSPTSKIADIFAEYKELDRHQHRDYLRRKGRSKSNKNGAKK